MGFSYRIYWNISRNYVNFSFYVNNQRGEQMVLKVILTTIIILLFSAICIENIQLRDKVRLTESIIWCYEHPIIPRKFKRQITRKII